MDQNMDEDYSPTLDEEMGNDQENNEVADTNGQTTPLKLTKSQKKRLKAKNKKQ